MIGRTVSHYKVFENLGGGGKGLVYKAEENRLGRKVALRVLPERHFDDLLHYETPQFQDFRLGSGKTERTAT
jgi:serine/threonine protein kinase